MSTNIKSDTANKNAEESLIEKRLRRRAKNKVKKEESKRVREEELRRKLCEPKDQRVRLVKQNELEKIIKKQQYVPTSSAIPNITAAEFPSLDKSRSKSKDKRQRSQGHQNVNSQLTIEEPSQATESDLHGVSTESPQYETTPPKQLPIQKNQSSTYIPIKPKRNDPICIDVITALKKYESTSVSGNRSIITKKDKSPRLAGNQLDSSNPERKKGKTRELPKEKKPTVLKRIIIKERESRKSDQEQHASVGEMQVIADKLPHLGTNLSSDLAEIPIEQNSACKNKEIGAKSENVSHCVGANERGSVSTLTDKDGVFDQDNVSLAQLKNEARQKLHSRKFREYCDHVLSPSLDMAVTALLSDIVKFQDRAYFNDPVKAHAKRRFVVGFREVKKYLGLNKLRLIIIAPDLEKIKSEGGLDDIINQIKGDAMAQDVPCVFAVGRKQLKILTNKSPKIPGISCVGVLNWEGTEDNFSTIKNLLPLLREQYAYKMEQINKQFEGDRKIDQVEATLTDKAVEVEPLADVNTAVIATFLSNLTRELRNQ